MSSINANAKIHANGLVVKSAAQARAERDHHQQYVAKQRYTALRKEIPKKLREREIERAREAKRLAFEGEPTECGEIKEQGFASTIAVSAVGAAAAAAMYSVNRMRKEVSGAVDRVDEALASTTGSVVSTAHLLVDRVNTTIEGFANTAKSILGAFWIVPTAILAHYIIGHFSDIPLLPVMASLFLAKLFGEEIWNLLGKWFSFQEQSGEGVCSIGALIISAACAVCIPTRSASGVAGEVMKRMSSYVRAKEGFECFFKDALKYAEKAVNAILSFFSDKEVNWIGTSERLVDRFCDKVTVFESLVRTESDKVQLADLLDAVSVQQEALGLKMTVRDPQTLLRIERGLTRLSLLLQPYQGAITASRNFRPEPTFICMYGGSGVGKTTLATKMACTILVKSGLCEPDEALRNLWQKGNTEYWNGYVNQKCLVMDDCFQVKPVKGETDSEYMNVIRMIGNWAYALNFADLESKGKFYFDTPLVIGTTNCANIYNMADMVVTEPAAVTRRIKFPYRIEVNPEYWGEEKQLDYKKLEHEFSANLDAYDKRGDRSSLSASMDAYPWEAWKLVRHDFTNPEAGGPERTVRSLIDEVVQRIVSSREAHQQSVDNLNRFMRNIGDAMKSDKGVKEQSGLAEVAEGSEECFFDTVEVDKEALERALRLASEEIEIDYEDIKPRPTTDSVRDFVMEGMPRMSVGTDTPRASSFHAHINDTQYRKKNRPSYSFRYVAMKRLAFEVRKRICSWAENIRKFFVGLTPGGVIKFAFCTLAATVVVGLAVGVFAAVRYIFKAVKSKFAGTPRGTPQSNVKESSGPPRKTLFKPKSIKTQSDIQRNRVHNNIFSNTFKLVVHATEQDFVVGQVQFVQLHVAMMPKHFRRQLEERLADGGVTEASLMSFVHATHNQVVKFKVGEFLACKIVEVEDSDLLFMRFPNGFISAASKITQHFLKADDLNKVIQAKPAIRLDIAELDPKWQEKPKGALVSRNTMLASTFNFLPNLASQAYENSNVLEYQMPTEEGMCGAPLCISENRYYGGACYLGMHVAGAPGWFSRVGYSNVVTQEQALAAVAELETITDNFREDAKNRGFPIADIDPEEQSGLLANSFVTGSFTLIGRAEKPVSLNPSTKLILSPIGEEQPFGPNVLAPARLRPFMKDGERVFPMAVGLSGYATPLDYRPLPNMDAIVSMATKPFRLASIGDYRGVLTKREAVEGIEGMKLKPIARGKSPGYPFVHEVRNGKREYFGNDGPFEFESPQCVKLLARVDEVIANAKAGVRLCHIFTDFLKDETRPLRKVEQGETRVISGAPLDLVIATRMYFGAWMASMFRHCVTSGVAPGINPYNEWYLLASRLTSKGEKVFDGDFKAFDKSEQPYVHYAILDFINHWYGGTKEDERVRGILWLELVHSRHLGGDGVLQDIVYQWSKSMPSGHPLTTPVNSMYSLITLTGCYAKATGDNENMWDYAFINTFGDDNITNVSDKVAEVFNQVTVARDMDELFGLTYTAGSKTGELVPYTDLGSCTFLKRSFVRDVAGSGGWIAPIDIASHLYSCYYYKNKRDPNADMAHNLEEMLGELSLHGVQVWEQHSGVAFEILNHMGRVPRYMTREGYRSMMSQRLDAWF